MLLKASVLLWQEAIYTVNSKDLALLQLNQELISTKLENGFLGPNATEVVAVISECISKKVVKTTKCLKCRAFLTFNTPIDSPFENFDYLLKLSHGDLSLTAVDLTHYVSKSFAMLELSQNLCRKIKMPTRIAAEHVLSVNDVASYSFLCDDNSKTINLIILVICNMFLNNAQKLVTNQVRRVVVEHFKQRQKKRQRTFVQTCGQYVIELAAKHHLFWMLTVSAVIYISQLYMIWKIKSCFVLKIKSCMKTVIF